MVDSNPGETGSARPPQFTSAARTTVFAVLAWVSLLCPPWQALVTTSIPLYLHNQQDLYHNVSVLHPFLGLAMGVALLALPVYLLALRSRALAGVLWFYYFAGFAFLGLVTIHGWEAGLNVTVAASVTVGIVFILVQFVANRWWNLRRASGYFALFTVGFVAVDAFQFASRHVPLPDELETREATLTSEAHSGGHLPNFYHLVLDEYQTDMFEFVLDSELRDSLGGFVFFNDTTTPFGRTRMALASLFSSRYFDFETSQDGYLQSAFNGRQSMLTQVLNAGYHTEAYLHARVLTPEPPFHRIRYHRAPSGYRADSSQLFRDLWIYANSPLYISGTRWFAFESSPAAWCETASRSCETTLGT